ncbi:MAG: helix-turn-helix domain-containing protein [Candidatus Aminicenantes bacterium]|nr:helix-turn-helix domain-containing protein [Candidatus Aminicenantes bacterium]
MLNLPTIDELRQRLKIPKKTIYKWAREKKVPCRKLGKHLRFIESEIDQWLQSGESFENGKSV